MKILAIADFPAPYRVEVFKGLAKEYQLDLFFTSSSSGYLSNEWYYKPNADFQFGLLDNAETKKEFERCVKRLYNYDLVLCYNPWAKLSRLVQRKCMRKNIPYILNADGALAINTKFPKKQIKTFYSKRAALCFAGCERAVEYFKTYGANPQNIIKHSFTSLFEEQILTTPYTKEQKLEFKKELGIEDKVTFITVGQFIHRKGFDLLLDAWAKTKHKAQLYIIGGGPLEDEYLKTIADTALENVHIIGFKKPHDLKKYYAASDVFVFPTREDIWGLVVNEALANALPTISSNKCTAGNELIKNGVNGFIYDVDNTEELAKLVDMLYYDSDLRERLAWGAALSVKNHTYENVIKHHIYCINKIINRQR